MDWNEVSLQELAQGLSEVDLGKPRPPAEFLSRFSAPANVSKWTARLKSNVYYFRANYLLLFSSSYLLFFIRNPLALVGVLLVVLGVLCTNNAFASLLNDHGLYLVRRIHPPTALKIRARTLHAPSPLSPTTSRHHTSHTKVYILSLKRTTFIALCLILAAVLLRLSAAWRTLAWGTLFGIGLPLLHATCRSPNLKAKLANARDEFKEMWKHYKQEMTDSLGLGLGGGSMSNGGGGIGVYGNGGGYVDYNR